LCFAGFEVAMISSPRGNDASANMQRASVYLGSEVLALQSADGTFY
jgi:hypothetical protein